MRLIMTLTCLAAWQCEAICTAAQSKAIHSFTPWESLAAMDFVGIFCELARLSCFSV